MRVSVLERGRLIRHPEARLPDHRDDPWERHIPAPLFDLLERTEQAREALEAKRAQGTGKPPKSSAVFSFVRRKGQTVATVGPWVGVLEVGDLQLELLPKVDREEKPARLTNGEALTTVRGNLLTMLEVAGDVPVRLRGPAATAMRQATLKDALVRLFLEALIAEMLRGEPRAYVTTEEDLGTIRGRLMLKEQITRSAGKEHRFWCRFDELVGDPRIGGRLKAACAVLARRSLGAESRRLLHQARALLDEAPDLTVARDRGGPLQPAERALPRRVPVRRAHPRRQRARPARGARGQLLAALQHGRAVRALHREIHRPPCARRGRSSRSTDGLGAEPQSKGSPRISAV
jgi:hypothetical protein